MKAIQILLKAYALQHGISEAKAAETLCKKSEDGSSVNKDQLKDDVLTIIADADKSRVTKLKGEPVDKTKLFNEAYNKAKAEERAAFEKTLGTKFGIKIEGKKLTEIVDEVFNLKTPAQTELTVENVKKHPAYLELETEKKKAVDKLVAEHADAISKIESTNKQAQLTGAAVKTAMGYFEDLNPILSKDAKRAKNQKSDFEKKLKADGITYEPIEGKTNEYLILKDGKRLEDGHGNAQTLEGYTKNLASNYFDFQAQESKSNAGNRGKAGGGNATVPKNDEEYAQAIFSATTVEERQQIADSYEAANKDD